MSNFESWFKTFKMYAIPNANPSSVKHDWLRSICVSTFEDEGDVIVSEAFWSFCLETYMASMLERHNAGTIKKKAFKCLFVSLCSSLENIFVKT